MPMRVKIYFANGDQPLVTVFDAAQVRVHKLPEIMRVYDATQIEILGVAGDA